MKILRLLICGAYALVLAAAMFGEEHLEPVESNFSTLWSDYHNQVRKLLLTKPADDSDALMISLPSFAPESAVLLIGNEHGSIIISRRVSQQIWSNDTNSEIRVIEKRRAISTTTAQMIEKVFARAINETHYASEPRIGLDGISYYFLSWKRMIGNRAGKTWSPSEKSFCGRLVAIGDMMAKYAEAGDEEASSQEPRLRKAAEDLATP